MKVLIEKRERVFNTLLELFKSIESYDCLTKREQELILIAAITTNRSREGLFIHAQNALDAGATQDEIIQAITCCLPIAGIAAINEALDAVMALFN